MDVIIGGGLNSIDYSELEEKANENDIHPHLVVGVDVYRSLSAAKEDKVEVDKGKQLFITNSYNEKLFIHPPVYFSGRHYRIINLKDCEEYDSQSTILDLKNRLKEIGARGMSVINGDVLEQSDINSGYVLTPLYESELEELMKVD